MAPKRMLFSKILFIAAMLISPRALFSESSAPTSSEIVAATKWAQANFRSAAAFPFSFTYGGVPSSKLLPSWNMKRSEKTLDSTRNEQTFTFTDPKTGLEVQCVKVIYLDYPAVEWTLHFKNIGSSDTPILENIRSLDATLLGASDKDPVLHYSIGSPSTAEDYKPLEETLSANGRKHFAPEGGRPTDAAFPYFNLEDGSGKGIIVAVGWPGQWSADFSGNANHRVKIVAGQELTHLKLKPSEEIRSPLSLLLFYEGSWNRSQNLWRRWLIAHNMPAPGGKKPAPQLAGGSCPYFGPFVGNNEQNQEEFIGRYFDEKLKLDDWWIDAGWYPNNGVWTNTGTWEIDKKRFPNGLKAVSDYAHERGAKLIVWFEPERVTPQTWLYDQHPEWLLKAPPDSTYKPAKEGWRLLDLGNPTVLDWVTNHMDKLISENGIDVYRQDFNMQPLEFWRAADAPDRQGITENHYVTGYLAYWDGLRSRHPNMLIDSCASGGRRNDLETMRRAVPLWRSDYIIKPTGMQNQTYGISLWVPYEGLASQIFEKDEKGTKSIDTYAFRSDMFPTIHAHWDVRRKDLDYARLRELVDQWRAIAPDYMSDYYPLTPYKSTDDAWMAWQFDNPDAGEGFVQVFRRPQCPDDTLQLKFKGLSPDKHYRLINIDTKAEQTLSGRELTEKGIALKLSSKPDSAILIYKTAM